MLWLVLDSSNKHHDDDTTYHCSCLDSHVLRVQVVYYVIIVIFLVRQVVPAR
jgi:hypothetical protein